MHLSPVPLSPVQPSLAHALHAALMHAPDAEALVLIGTNGTQRATRGEIDAHARALAHRLLAVGIEPGDMILILLDHTYEAIPMFLGALYMGAVPLILPFPLPHATPAQEAERLAGLVRFFQPKCLLTVPRLHDRLAALKLEERNLAVPTLAWESAAVDVLTVPALTLSPRAGEDIAFLQFTSGTTGQPKAAMMSHRAMHYAFVAGITRFRFSPTDVGVFSTPLHHVSGLVSSVIRALGGGFRAVIIAPALWAQQPAILLRAMHEERATYSLLTSTGLNMLILRTTPKEIEGIDLSSLTVITVGAELIAPQTLEAFAKRFAAYGFNANAFTVGYAASEAYMTFQDIDEHWHADTVSATALINDKMALAVAPNAPDARRITACGTPLGNEPLEIRDEAGHALPDRHLGEIVVRAQTAFSGYWRNPELTAAVLQDGWYHTGDLGYTVDGELYVVGRVKDLIIVGGRNFLPDAIEEQARLATQLPMRMIVAFGVRSEALGTEQPVVVCELAAPADEAARDAAGRAIRTRVQQMLDVALGDVRFVEAGWCVYAGAKLARNACREKYLGEFPQAALPVQDVTASLTARVIAIFEEVLARKPIDPRANFFDEGADSIIALQLVLAVEKHFGRTLPQTFFQQPTVETLVRLLESGEGAAVGTAPHTPTATQEIKPQVIQPQVIHHWPTRPWNGQRARHILRWRIESLAFRRAYLPGMRQLAAWCGNPIAQRLLYPREVALFRHFWATLHGDAPLDRNELTCSLMGNALLQRSFRYAQSNESALSLSARQKASLPLIRELTAAITAPESNIGRQLLEIKGAARLEHALAAGRGAIILAYHATTRLVGIAPLVHNQLPHYTLSQRMYRQILRDTYGTTSADELARHWAAVRAQATQQARGVLQQGGVVAMTVDDIDADSPICAQIGTQPHPLITGFAALALATNAVVIPTYTKLHVDGRLTQHILPALDPGPLQMAHTARVAHLATQAGAFLNAAWHDAPASLDWTMMAAHLNTPTDHAHAGLPSEG